MRPKRGNCSRFERTGSVNCCLDFKVTPRHLLYAFITNMIHTGVNFKTVAYLTGHENSKETMDNYAKAKSSIIGPKSFPMP